MNYYTITSICIVALICMGSLAVARRNKKRDNNEEVQKSDIQKRKKFESMLESEEELVGVCPNDRKNRYYCALTQKRLFIEAKTGLIIIPLKDVKKVICYNYGAEKTNLAKDTFYVAVKASRTYKIYSYSDSFHNLVEQLRYRCPT